MKICEKFFSPKLKESSIFILTWIRKWENEPIAAGRWTPCLVDTPELFVYLPSFDTWALYIQLNIGLDWSDGVEVNWTNSDKKSPGARSQHQILTPEETNPRSWKIVLQKSVWVRPLCADGRGHIPPCTPCAATGSSRHVRFCEKKFTKYVVVYTIDDRFHSYSTSLAAVPSALLAIQEFINRHDVQGSLVAVMSTARLTTSGWWCGGCGAKWRCCHLLYESTQFLHGAVVSDAKFDLFMLQ